MKAHRLSGIISSQKHPVRTWFFPSEGLKEHLDPLNNFCQTCTLAVNLKKDKNNDVL